MVNGIDKAVDDLKSYPGLLQEFMQIMVDHAKDTQAGRKAVLGEAEKRVREWKEARLGKKGGRVKAKG